MPAEACNLSRGLGATYVVRHLESAGLARATSQTVRRRRLRYRSSDVMCERRHMPIKTWHRHTFLAKWSWLTFLFVSVVAACTDHNRCSELLQRLFCLFELRKERNRSASVTRSKMVLRVLTGQHENVLFSIGKRRSWNIARGL